MAAGGLEGPDAAPVEVAGEFNTVPTESIASIPGLGIFMIPIARRRAAKLKLTPQILLAVTSDRVHALKMRPAGIRHPVTQVEPGRSWPRGQVRAERAGRAFMRDKIALQIGEPEPLMLYAPSLQTNPWSAEVVRLLGGEAPEPLDLGEDDRSALGN